MKYFLLGAASSAFFLYGVAMAYGATDTTNIAAIANAPGRADREPGDRAARVRVPGGGVRVQGLGGAVPHVDARRVPGRAHAGDRVHVGRDEGGRLRGVDPRARWWLPAADLGLDAGRDRARRDLDPGGQRARDRADRHQADARLLEHRAGRLHPDRPHERDEHRDPRGDVLPGGLRGHDPRRLRRRDAGVREGRGADLALVLRGPVQAEPVPGGADDDLPALARGHPADRRVHREGGGVLGGDRGRPLAAGAARGR